MRDRQSERFWTCCLRRHTVTAALTGACVRPTLNCRLVRWTRTHTDTPMPKIISTEAGYTCVFNISERGFEDHEHVVEPLSSWTRLSENKMYFVSRPQKYVMFTNPQVSKSALAFSKMLLNCLLLSRYNEPCFSPLKVFYMWKKKKECSSKINEHAKQLLLQVSYSTMLTSY